MVERIRSITITIEVDTNKQTTRVTFHGPLDAIRWLEEHGYAVDGKDGPPVEAMKLDACVADFRATHPRFG